VEAAGRPPSDFQLDKDPVMNAKESKPTVDAVVRELRDPLLRYLSRYTGDEAAAEDLVQESLMRIAKGLAGFDGLSSVKTWAFAIASRVAADHFRKPERRLRIVEFDEETTAVDVKAFSDEKLVIDEMSVCVREVIDSLPEDYRAALVLHDLEGLSAREVAEASGCTLATAKIRIHRARRRLEQALRDECDFYRDEQDVLRCEPKP
jgi:RNA polymerase sigma-70 factor (ECF subfamily)